MWVDTPVTCSPHRSLNTSKGVIRCRDLRDCSDDEILAELRSQGVIEVKHIMTKKNGVFEPTNTFILTFNVPVTPKLIKAAYLKINVEPYIPNPLRCFKCQRFGHGTSTCSRNAACAKCGQEGHTDSSCQNTPHCANCAGSHVSYSKDCSVWIKQREITQVKFEKNITFFEARKLVEQRTATHNSKDGTIRPGVSYAHAIHNTHIQTRSACTQTDLTWPLTEKLPIAVENITASKVSSGSQTSSTTTNTNIPNYSSQTNKQTNNQSNKKIGPASKTSSNRQRKGSNDPVKQYNRYGSLEDEMDLDVTRSRSYSPKTKIKQKGKS
jgi:hypothetical protein